MKINIDGPYHVREPHTITVDTGGTRQMWPVVHRNNIGVGDAIAWAPTLIAAQRIADGLNIIERLVA